LEVDVWIWPRVFVSVFIFKVIDHGHAVVADHIMPALASIAFCCRKIASTDVRADKFQLKGKTAHLAIGPRGERGGKYRKEKEQSEGNP